ncbi:MAG: ABC transporter ATP-binding protein [Anaerolineae bacterium]|nr:ABC transporter ATP-binding protein [Anaerolineae bacterium]
MHDIILSTEGLVAGYGQTTILNGTTLSVRKAALTTVIGPNGAGKSTFFKTLFGMLPVRAGKIIFNGENIAGQKPLGLLGKGMAYVPQGRNIFPSLTVEHNLEFGGISLNNLPETRQRMEAVYKQFPILKTRAKAQAGTLSGGEQKMLEIGRAMLLEPKLLLIDEPSIGLSPIMAQQAFDLLLKLRDNGVTILLIEQNAKKALAISDYGIVLQQGRLALDGTADSVLNHPEIGHLFLGGAVQVSNQ